MLMIRNPLLSWMTISLLAWGAVVSVESLRAQQAHASKPAGGKPSGQRTFASLCAGCHGLDGRGGEGPNITGSPRVQHLTNAQLGSIISDGVPGTGMPAFHSLREAQVRSLVQYLRALEGTQQPRVLPGDANRGRQIFFGKGECSSCHSIGGQGGFLGPDLSAYGSTKAAKEILEDAVKTNRIAPTGYKLAVATTREGNRLEGIIRNEDNFSVQMQTADGSFHFLQKSDLQTLEFLNHSLMPTNYAERLSHDELNDIVSYLMSAAPPRKGEDTSRKFDGDNE